MENGRSEKNGINFGGPDGTRDPFTPDHNNDDTASSTSEEPEEFDECDCVEEEASKMSKQPLIIMPFKISNQSQR